MEELPREVVVQIVLMVGPVDACRLVGQLCKSFAALVADEWLWNRFCVDAQQRACSGPLDYDEAQACDTLAQRQFAWAEWAVPKPECTSWKQHFINNCESVWPSGIHQRKVVVLGKSFAGKSAIVKRYKMHKFVSCESTIGAGYYSHMECLSPPAHAPPSCWASQVQLDIWDTAGIERYRMLVASIYIGGIDGAMIVFDLSTPHSWKDVLYWHQVLVDKQVSPNLETFPKILLCNKMDLKEQFPEANQLIRSAFEWAQAHGYIFFLCSALDGTNVDLAFSTLAKRMAKAIIRRDGIQQRAVQQQPSKRRNNGCCCC
eukprot:TRINITY_DN11854_c0_g1_i1.p1 TRINITY_DN11854_c0_g1~~TRINITY_DN11854_c0_g1_i1.p1  ORF type:complete len:316 (+),score=35.48 TRINITY_DN11854_c0_g1_i1:3-950(+)